MFLILALLLFAPAVQQTADSPKPVYSTCNLSEPVKFRVSGGIIAGSRIDSTTIAYPEKAKSLNVEGTVRLGAVIGPEGNVCELTVISGPKELIEASVEVAKQFRYKPFALNGKAVPVSTTIDLKFVLERKK